MTQASMSTKINEAGHLIWYCNHFYLNLMKQVPWNGLNLDVLRDREKRLKKVMNFCTAHGSRF